MLEILLIFEHRILINSHPLELSRNVQSAQFRAVFVVTVHKGKISAKSKQNPANRDG